MARDQLLIALRVRRRAVHDAQRALAAALAAEQVAADDVTAAVATIRRESEIALAASSSDNAVEAFAAWLPRGLGDQSQAQAALSQAEFATAQARAALAVARTAEATIESVLDRRVTIERATEARHEQRSIDEIARNDDPPSRGAKDLT